MDNQTRLNNFLYHYYELGVTFDNLLEDVFYHANNKSLRKLYTDIFNCLTEIGDTIYVDTIKFDKIKNIKY